MGGAQILQQEHAIASGAGGLIGAAVAKGFASEGAEVFAAGRTKSNVEDVTKQSRSAGSHAHAVVIEALDDEAINETVDSIVKQTGCIDIVFNAVGPLAKDYGNGEHAVDLAIEEFMVPLTKVVRSQFEMLRELAPSLVIDLSRALAIAMKSGARAGLNELDAIAEREILSRYP